MRGHIRKRGASSYEYIVDVGTAPAQRCEGCNERYWLERRPKEACPACGGRLHETEERRRAIKAGFVSRREAQAAMAKVMVSVEEKTYVAPSRLTVREYLTKEWLPAIEATVRPTTYRSYVQHVSFHIVPHIGSLRLEKVTGATLNALYAKLASEGKLDGKRGLAPRTVHHVHVCLHRAFKDAVRWGRLFRNPVDAADPPRVAGPGSREMKTWSAQQVRAFLEATKDDRLYPLWRLFCLTGMRRGEVLGVRWEDIDLEARRLSVRRSLIPLGEEVIVSEPKTARGRRSIALDAETVEVLKAQAARQLAEQQESGDSWIDSGFLCTKENGQPYHPEVVSRRFRQAVRKAMLPMIRPHDLRHTHATLALQAGIHPKVVSERLGHANVSITLDTYSHAIPALQEEAAARIAELVGGEGRPAVGPGLDQPGEAVAL
jgi:integrase